MKTMTTTKSNKSNAIIKVLLWVLQILLAFIFGAHGWLMVAPPEALVETINTSIGHNLSLFIGVAELLAAAALILPSMTRILPWLTPLAGLGLMIVMVCATAFHVTRGEMSSAIMAVFIFVLVTLMTYARWKPFSIASRSTH